MNKAALVVTGFAALAVSAAVNAATCDQVSILVETEETSPLTNSGTAWFTFLGQTYTGSLNGLVVGYDPVAQLPTRIKYVFRSDQGTLWLTGYPDFASFAALTFDENGDYVKYLLDVDIVVTGGSLDGLPVTSQDVRASGSLDWETKLETFVSNKVGEFCR